MCVRPHLVASLFLLYVAVLSYLMLIVDTDGKCYLRGTDCRLLQAGSNDRHIRNNKGKKRWVMTAWKGDSISWQSESVSHKLIGFLHVEHLQREPTYSMHKYHRIHADTMRRKDNIQTRAAPVQSRSPSVPGSYENLLILVKIWMFVTLFKKLFSYWVRNSVFGLGISVLRKTLRNICVDEAAVVTGMNEAWLRDETKIIWWLTLTTVIFSEWLLETGFYCPTPSAGY